MSTTKCYVDTLTGKALNYAVSQALGQPYKVRGKVPEDLFTEEMFPFFLIDTYYSDADSCYKANCYGKDCPTTGESALEAGLRCLALSFMNGTLTVDVPLCLM